jgi:hypothetical protein
MSALCPPLAHFAPSVYFVLREFSTFPKEKRTS